MQADPEPHARKATAAIAARKATAAENAPLAPETTAVFFSTFAVVSTLAVWPSKVIVAVFSFVATASGSELTDSTSTRSS